MGTHARDKDAVVASMLTAEMVCYYTSIGKTVYQRLLEIYSELGYVLDCNISIPFKGLNAMKDMNAVVNGLKEKPATNFGIYKVATVRDYSKNLKTDIATGTATEIEKDFPKVNCVYYELENGSFVCVRPSGTEPKLKIYFSVKSRNKQEAESQLEQLQAAAKAMLGQ